MRLNMRWDMRWNMRLYEWQDGRLIDRNGCGITTPSSFVDQLLLSKSRLDSRLYGRYVVIRIEYVIILLNNRLRDCYFKLLKPSLNLPKRLIQIFNLIYPLRILNDHNNPIMIKIIKCYIRRNSPRRIKSTNLHQLFNRHNMYFNMLILPSIDLFLLVYI